MEETENVTEVTPEDFTPKPDELFVAVDDVVQNQTTDEAIDNG